MGYALLGLFGDIVPRGTQASVFEQMFWVFTGLGVLVGTVVIGYLLWKAYRYRAGASPADEDDVKRPELGVLPTGSHGARHLAISFSISAVLVLSLVTWTYGALLYVQQGVHQNPPDDVREQMDVTVVGHQFYWEFQYENVSGGSGNLSTTDELRVPEGALVDLRVTSADVFHNFGIPALKVKTDAVPGQTTRTWFIADQQGSYLARCYELCGQGHSYMTAQVVVMRPDAFHEWYANQTANATTA